MTITRPRARTIASAGLLVVALVGYLVFVSSTKADTTRISGLVITQPPVKGLKPLKNGRRSVPASSMPFAAATKAAKLHPDQTGAYATAWQAPAPGKGKASSSSSSLSANLLVELLPDTATATKVRREAVHSYTDTKALAKSSLAIASRFSVKGVPGSTGVMFTSTRPGASPTTAGYAVAFQFQRAVVVDFVQAPTSGGGVPDSSAIARSEYRLLHAAEPGFSLSVTSRPALPSLIYWIVAVAVASLPLLVPWWVRWRRERRAARRDARALYEVRSRGHKAVRRHRSPAWARPHR